MPNNNAHLPKTDLDYANSVNHELLELILYRQKRKYALSASLLGVLLALVVGLLLMAAGKFQIDAGVETLLTITVTAVATSMSKLTDFWFNNQSDDAQLVKEATSFSLGLNGPSKGGGNEGDETETG